MHSDVGFADRVLNEHGNHLDSSIVSDEELLEASLHQALVEYLHSHRSP